MTNHDHTQINGYSDYDWAGNAIDHKSTTGFCMFVGGNPSWHSKKQHVVTRSSVEDEYRAMASTTCELIWLKGLLSDLGFSSSIPITLFCDNQVDMHIIANPIFHEKTKHIEVDRHFIHQQVQSQVIKTCYIRSHDQLANLFTKVLTSAHFHRLLSKLGSLNPLDPTRGGVLKKSIRLPLQHRLQGPSTVRMTEFHRLQGPPTVRMIEFKVQSFSFTPTQVVELIPTAIPLHNN